MGLSTWVLITLVELQSLVAKMLQQEILGMDKVIETLLRIYAHMDRLIRINEMVELRYYVLNIQ